MASKTRLEGRVRGLRWREVEADLTESPALLEVRDDRGRNWLHVCCGVDPAPRGLRPADSIRTADVLLAAGLGLDDEAFREGDWKATPLWYAIARGRNRKLAGHLLGLGCDPNHCLWAAAFHDDVRAIDLLVSAGADVDPVTEDETPFLSAVKTSHFLAAKALLERGADVDFRDVHGRTALHYMLRKGSDLRHFRMLAGFGARGDIPDAEGRTAAAILARKRDPAFRKLAEQLV